MGDKRDFFCRWRKCLGSGSALPFIHDQVRYVLVDLYLGSLDSASFPLRSVDGFGLENDASLGIGQHCINRVCDLYRIFVRRIT